MKAYIVVGPTNVQPRRRNSFDSAVDSGLLLMVLSTSDVSFFWRDLRSGAKRHT